MMTMAKQAHLETGKQGGSKNEGLKSLSSQQDRPDRKVHVFQLKKEKSKAQCRAQTERREADQKRRGGEEGVYEAGPSLVLGEGEHVKSSVRLRGHAWDTHAFSRGSF